MIKTKFVDVATYGFRLYLCRTQDELLDVVRIDYPDESDDTEAKGKMQAWRGDKPDSVNTIAIYASSPETLAHECFHAAMSVCERIGFPVRAETDEPVAYLIGFMFNEYVKALYPGQESWQ
jgi:hypothetical protein